MTFSVLNGDAKERLKTIKSSSVDCCITSPPYYGLRDYGDVNQIGLESTPYEYIDRLADVFDEVKRVLKDSGTLWVVIGDSYAGSQKTQGWDRNKDTWKASKGSDNQNRKLRPYTDDVIKKRDLIGIPWALAFELRRRGWYLRQDIIWNKLNGMPESVKNRCTRSHEYVFLLSKSPRYFFDYESIMEPVAESTEKRFRQNIEQQKGSDRAHGREKMKPVRYGGNKYTNNKSGFFRTKSGSCYDFTEKKFKRSVWGISTAKFKGEHFAVFPEKLVELMVLAGCPRGGVILDPFTGSGTTGVVALLNGRSFIGCELNQKYHVMATKRIQEAWEASPSLF